MNESGIASQPNLLDPAASYRQTILRIQQTVSQCLLHMHQLLPEFPAFAVLSAVPTATLHGACVANIIIHLIVYTKRQLANIHGLKAHLGTFGGAAVPWAGSRSARGLPRHLLDSCNDSFHWPGQVLPIFMFLGPRALGTPALSSTLSNFAKCQFLIDNGQCSAHCFPVHTCRTFRLAALICSCTWHGKCSACSRRMRLYQLPETGSRCTMTS